MLKSIEPSVVAFIIGVLAAVAAFLATQGIAHIRDGIRFRRLLAAEVTSIAQAYFDHLPEIKRLRLLGESIVSSLEQGGEEEDRLPPIWDSDIATGRTLMNGSQFLSISLFKEGLAFYESVSRLGDCIRTYNDSVHQIRINAAPVALGHAMNAVACLRFIERFYRDIVRRGCSLAIQLARHYRFLEVDTGRMSDVARRVEE